MNKTTNCPDPEEDGRKNHDKTTQPIFRRYLNTKGAACYVDGSPRWLEELRRTGGGPHYSKFGRKKVLYCIDDLDEWIREHRRRNTSEPDPSETEA